MSDTLTIPVLLGDSCTRQLMGLLAEAQGEERLQVIAVHDPETGFAAFVEVAAGVPVLWRLAGPMLPAQAQTWFQSLAESFAANPTPRAN